jgi:non-heme chloroperoxidase
MTTSTVGSTEARIRSADGTELHLVSAGDPEAVPVVALHGFSLSHYVFAEQLATAAARGRHVVAPDLRGHGDSGLDDTTPEPARWVEDLDAVLTHLGRPAVLLAWSYSGLIVGEYLARRGADRVLGVLMVAAAVSVPPAVVDPDDEFVPLLPGLLSDDASARAVADERFQRLLTRAPLSAEQDAALAAATGRVVPGLRRTMMSRPVDHTAAYAALRVPVHLVQGADDRLFAAAISRHTHSVVTGSTLSIVEECGHAPFLEYPDRFDEELAGLLARIPRN